MGGGMTGTCCYCPHTAVTLLTHSSSSSSSSSVTSDDCHRVCCSPEHPRRAWRGLPHIRQPTRNIFRLQRTDWRVRPSLSSLSSWSLSWWPGTTRTQMPTVSHSTSAPLTAATPCSSTASSAPTARSSTSSTSSVTGGLTWTAHRCKHLSLSSTTFSVMLEMADCSFNSTSWVKELQWL